MSNFEDKLAATQDFLANRASLRRLTNHTEVGSAIGEMLYSRKQRRITRPVRREKVIAVLKAVDDKSVEDQGFMLSALVVHFWDNSPGHRFWESAVARGLFNKDQDREAFHLDQVNKIYAAYPEFAPISLEPVTDNEGDEDEMSEEGEAPFEDNTHVRA